APRWSAPLSVTALIWGDAAAACNAAMSSYHSSATASTFMACVGTSGRVGSSRMKDRTERRTCGTACTSGACSVTQRRRNSSFDSVLLRVNSDRLLITASLPGDPAACAKHMRPKLKQFAHQLDRPLRKQQAADGGNGQRVPTWR